MTEGAEKALGPGSQKLSRRTAPQTLGEEPPRGTVPVQEPIFWESVPVPQFHRMCAVTYDPCCSQVPSRCFRVTPPNAGRHQRAWRPPAEA